MVLNFGLGGQIAHEIFALSSLQKFFCVPHFKSIVTQSREKAEVRSTFNCFDSREIRFDDPVAGQCSSAGMHNSRKSLDPNTIQQVPIKWHNADAAEVAGL